jgi:segregation and condensation protein B
MGMQGIDDLPELAPYLPEMDDIEDEARPPETTPAEASPAQETEEAQPSHG